MRAFLGRLSESLLPASVVGRFFLISILVAVLTAFAAMGVSQWIGRSLVLGFQEDTGYTVLRNAVDIMGRARITDELMYSKTLELAKEDLASRLGFVAGYFDSYHLQCQLGKQSREEAEIEALDRLAAILVYDEQGIFVLDDEHNVVVPPALDFLEHALSKEHSNLNEIIERLHSQSRQAHNGDAVYAMFRDSVHEADDQRAYLLAALRYEPWGMVLYAGLPVDQLDEGLAEDRLSNLDELRARLAEIVVGETGYLYFFEEDCTVIGHPTLRGRDLSTVRGEGLENNICVELKAAAERPWGENKVRYLWDRPDDVGNYVHPKISWVTRDPSTGWYIATSAYIDELEASLPQLELSIFLPALGSIVIFNIILALLLRSLLSPVKELTSQCQKVAMGDLTAHTLVEAPGEMGFLCRHFNNMVDSLRLSNQREKDKRNELEELNRNLESIVDDRTMDLKLKAEKLEEANVRLKELDKLKSSLLSSVSHELRTPLTSVLGFAKIINRDFSRYFLTDDVTPELLKKGGRIQSNLQIIENEGQRLSRLINDVLDLNKIEAGHMQWRDEIIDSTELVKWAADAVSGLFEANPDVELQLNIPEVLPVIRGDFDRLLQVQVNLLNNAAKFTSKGRVVVSARATEAGWLRVEIRDTGIGIAEEDLERIFDKFHQVREKSETVKASHGTGLGLTICRQIMAYHRGRVWAESTLGEGSVFILEIPSIPIMDSDSEESYRLPEHRERPLVLVVDDEPSTREYLSQLLGEHEFDTVTAVDGAEGIAKARELQPDIIAMDLLMPGMHGRDAVSALRSKPETSSIPVIVISAYPNEAGKDQDATLIKPIDEEQFMGTILSLLGRQCSTEPCLSLRPDDSGKPGVGVLLCDGTVTPCDNKALWQTLESGFTGTIVIPSNMVESMDLERLQSIPGVQLLMMPDD